ncbi:hypothetical protein B0T14DRAFT_498563 [Immersiella caudata]|uniref:Uncharacterized protein n=1 Tax=Immersiella caudata TaxID=314043 RepID=A0AA39WLF0_9PEZI|nr:hypothetical protein B0T14DRAFT_498563 [Immersiella caudata]
MGTPNTGTFMIGVPTATHFDVAGTYDKDRFNCPTLPVTISPANGIQFDANVKAEILGGLPALPLMALSASNVPFTCLYSVAYTQSAPSTTVVVTSRQCVAAPTPSRNGTATGGHNSVNSGISTGAAAGIGIAVAVAVIAIAAAAAWLFLHRRRQDPEGSPVLPIMGPDKSQKRAAAIGPPPPSKGAIGGLAGLHHYLLDGEGDSEMVGELTSLGHLLKDHVQASYHKAPVGRDHLSQVNSSLSSLGLDRATQAQIASLALNERTRHIAIRGLLARIIFSALDVSSASSLSLLPPSVAAFSRTIPLDLNKELTPQAPGAAPLRTSSIRTGSIDRSPLQVPANIDTQIRDTRVALDGFLSIFVHDDSRARNNQAKSLERAIRACAKFGYALFSHPCEWAYLFWNEAASSSVVVLPGLERFSGPDGEVYKSGHVVVHPTIENV